MDTDELIAHINQKLNEPGAPPIEDLGVALPPPRLRGVRQPPIGWESIEWETPIPLVAKPHSAALDKIIYGLSPPYHCTCGETFQVPEQFLDHVLRCGYEVNTAERGTREWRVAEVRRIQWRGPPYRCTCGLFETPEELLDHEHRKPQYAPRRRRRAQRRHNSATFPT
jgi:hypothetical protein